MLTAGDMVGPYRIVSLLSRGAGSAVYRATDVHQRDVALEIFTEPLGEQTLRDARAVAGLNHPNICPLYDVGPNYLVMELVEGVTLADRIEQGGLPLAEALAVGRQIADAL